ncbi:TPA: LysR family transcriptional regulator ArgP [Stenotrophomonas maltophilia]|uniref:LysR family transcriptional regulator ArgP n=1 Tax=Stenotrophomonas maltophilia TaxID=40324 RepID=UPI0031B8BAA4|nr:LysR family transcriptional regulator ArgP [Stenotrophomonas maltophilia]HDS1024577.1 LysR family transcriptional regulator ArgP [Stenotrophomonas maltophilia]HDS1028961.1 LysR family transcriptional regulator ArgP [Stenotrophomonas maltophilia]HDS1033529.1 LysR family transcriptional regulator ArgP [Stenotrophomonas maltophilia]
MDLVHPQLAAFAAVLEEGSFEAAARRLAISPSALSQRIKALEDRLGQVLLVRQAPCRPTAAGEVLLRSVRPMQVLQSEALAELLPERGHDATRTPIPLAVNDDSLDTWFVAAIAELHQRHGYLFDLRMDDQDHTLELLRDGSVLGAITAAGRALKGCNLHPLGAMRYQAIASPAFARQHFAKGMHADALAHAPMIVFNRKDDLQARFVRRLTRARLQPPVHYLPSSTGFVEAAARGLGWCLAPETLVAPAVRAGQVVVLEPRRWLDVPLYWQHAAVRSSTLQHITQALHAAARGTLR